MVFSHSATTPQASIVDSYLSFSQAVLRLARRPLTSRQIVEIAYRNDMVPSQLYGKTQHKTVGARLSEDILKRRDRSLFFRNEPGKFFLREFLSDPSIPENYRTPIVARRRRRELRRGSPLAINRENVDALVSAAEAHHDKLSLIANANGLHYAKQGSENNHGPELYVWSYVMFRRGLEVLTYRHGRYREGRDGFMQRRSIGFFTPVVDADRDLFDYGDHGIILSGLRAVAFDLDIPHIAFQSDFIDESTRITDFVVAQDVQGHEDLLVVLWVECPPHFEPLTRRLAINDLRWIRLDVPVNHIEDFDPWSQLIITRSKSTGLVTPG